MSKGNQNIINEFHSKCLAQNKEITTNISEIRNKSHNISALDRVKEKVLERLENYEESLKMSESILNQMGSDDRLVWKR